MYKKELSFSFSKDIKQKLFKLHILAVLSISMVSMETSKVFLSGDITKRGSLLIEHARHSPSRSKCIVRNKTDERGYSISFYNSSRRPKGENKQPNLVQQPSRTLNMTSLSHSPFPYFQWIFGSDNTPLMNGFYDPIFTVPKAPKIHFQD